MRQLFQLVFIVYFFVLPGLGAAISFNGTVSSVGGLFPNLLGTEVAGIVEFEEVSQDQDPDPGRGVYIASLGRVLLYIDSSVFVINSGVNSPLQVNTYFQESVQSFQVSATDPSYTIQLTFEGFTNQQGPFLASDAFPAGVNWTALGGSYGVLAQGLSPTAEVPEAGNNEIVFAIENGGEVPEPSTMLLVAAGAGCLVWKRRQSR